ncbi:MAG: hypothetical protein IPK13_14245 [Deltaproteobacteria bacterium]|nr:hypothetical protein [Deltaproteobacteria bacterium]
MERRVLHVIDGSGYIFRAYYAIRSLTASSGEPTNATYGFATMIEKALREETPTHLALTFDAGGPNFRHEMFEAYKGTRTPPPEDLVAQIPRIHEVSSCFQIRTFVVSGVEADDVIASLVRLARQDGFDVELITGDKDLMQLVDDHVRVYEPMKNQRFRAPEVEEKFGVPPELIADALALAGDTSDNIPGVRGIGMKTAAKLLREHGGLEGVLTAAGAGAIKGKTGERIAAEAGAARLSRRLVALKDDVDLGVTMDELRYPGPDASRLAALYAALDFRKAPSAGKTGSGPSAEGRNADGSADAWGGTGAGAGADAGSSGGSGGSGYLGEAGDFGGAGDFGAARGMSRLDATPVRPVSNVEELNGFVGALRGAKRLALELELSSTRVADAEIYGMSVAIDAGMTVYLPFKCGRSRPEDAATPVLSWTLVAEALKAVLEDREIEKVSTDLKVLTEFLLREGIELRGACFDSTIATFLLRPDDMNHGYASTARRYLDHEVEDRTAALRVDRKRISFADLDLDRAAKLAGERAQVGLAASHHLAGALVAAELVHVFRDVELSLVPVLARIELSGVRIDVDRLKALSKTFSAQLKTLEQACFEAAGVEFNLGSPKQLQKILFEDLGLKVIKRTKTGPSTDHEVLEALAAEHPLPQRVLEHRQMQKLQSTYVEALPKMVCPATGRVHTVLSQTSAATGRLASNDPEPPEHPHSYGARTRAPARLCRRPGPRLDLRGLFSDRASRACALLQR